MTGEDEEVREQTEQKRTEESMRKSWKLGDREEGGGDVKEERRIKVKERRIKVKERKIKVKEDKGKGRGRGGMISRGRILSFKNSPLD